MTSRTKAALWTSIAVPVCVLAVAALTFFLNPLAVNDALIRYHLWQQHVETRYVLVDGYNLHYFEAHPPHGQGIPLLLIHGLGARGEDWSPMISTLAARGFHVFVPDLLGYGRSSRPQVDYSISLQEKTVLDFMRAVGIPQADVGGWSMGGWIALKLALDHPEAVDRLVLYDSAGIYFPPTFDASLFIPTDSPGLNRLVSILTPKPRPMAPFVSRAAIRRLQSNGWIIRRSVASMEAGRDLADFQLHQLHKPTLIVWGDMDKLIPLQVGEEMHRKIAGSSLLVVEGCGHLAPGECARPVLNGTIDFLAANPPIENRETSVSGTAH